MGRPVARAARPPGSRRLAGFALAAAAYVLGLFHRSAPATIAPDLAQAFGTSAAMLGLLAATYFWVYTAMQIPSGVLADTLGPRRLLAGGGLVAAGGAALFAAAPSVEVAAAGRVLVALGSSVAFVACLKLIASWFDPRLFASLTGTVVLVGNLSSAAAGGPFAWLLERFGWREVILVLAAASALVALASWRVVDELQSRAGAERGTQRAPGWREGLAGVLANRATWPIFLANFGMGASFVSYATLWAVPYLVEVHGLSRIAAAGHVTVLMGVFAVAGLAVGGLSDRIGRRKPLLLGGAAVLAAAWLTLLAGWPMRGAGGYALSALMGLAAAGLTISWTLSKEVNAPQFAGIATGVVNMGIFLGPAVLQPAVGWVLDLGSTPGATAAAHSAAAWQRGIAVMAGLSAFGLASALFVRETGTRKAPKEAT